jgi:hypothetical protein
MDGGNGQQAATGRNRERGRKNQGSPSGTKRPRRVDEQGQDKPPTEDEPEVDRKPEQTDPPVPGRTPVQIS